jgi:endo-1,4-beta-D-glucanase Y
MRVSCGVALITLLLSVTAMQGGCGDAGGANTTGTGNTGGSAPAVCSQQTPPAAAGGANFPFPQHRLSPNCGYPTNCNDADVMTAWTLYKQRMIVGASSANCPGTLLRVQRPENGNDTVSEGTAYGMLFAVYMNDRPTFDGIWTFAKCRRKGNGLLSWHLDANGNVIDVNPATDADEDAAFALVMAARQWGGDYMNEANALISAILTNEVESGSNVLKPGDIFGGSNETNPSYFAPAYYRVFAQVSGNSRWMQVLDTSYTVLEACANDQTGLVPDWCSASGQPLRTGTYGYDATRTPFRIAQDACWNNEARAIAYVNRVATFFDGLGPSNIDDGYQLNGTPSSTFFVPAFAGPAAVSGMPSDKANLMRQIYALVGAVIKSGTSASYNYYNGSWGLLSVMMMTGNMVNFVGL